MSEISDLISTYYSWLKDRTILLELRDWTKITTPYLDRHNDYVEIYARRIDGAFELTDDGHTLQDLEMSGCKLDTEHRKSLLDLTLNGFGVRRERDALLVKATRENFPLRKHNLVQSILAVNDLFVLASPTTQNLFFDDVKQWLDDNEIRYVQQITFQGVSGFQQTFDFAIPKSRRAPERLLKVVSSPTREKAQNVAFAWHDIHEIRPENCKAYAILNDNQKPVSASVIEALLAYDIEPISWSSRDNSRPRLSA